MEGAAVKIYVGADEKLYTVPRALLCHHSDYFQTSLNGKFRESTNGTVHLPEDDPESFVLVLEWMYKEYLHILEDHDWETRPRQAELKRTCRILCKLCCTADKLQMRGIEGYIISQLDHALKCAGDKFPMDSATVRDFYTNTPDSSAPQRFVLEKLALNLTSDTGHPITEFRDCIEGADEIPDFAVKLFTKMRSIKTNEFSCEW